MGRIGGVAWLFDKAQEHENPGKAKIWRSRPAIQPVSHAAAPPRLLLSRFLLSTGLDGIQLHHTVLLLLPAASQDLQAKQSILSYEPSPGTEISNDLRAN